MRKLLPPQVACSRGRRRRSHTLRTGTDGRAHLVQNPPAVQKTPARFLGQEDLLEKGQATHFSILGFLWWLSC